jgi:hypothetical protein
VPPLEGVAPVVPQQRGDLGPDLVELRSFQQAVQDDVPVPLERPEVLGHDGRVHLRT